MARKYEITITGTMPLLMHHDDIQWADRMEAWKNDPANKKTSKAGDDRSPAHRWIGALYHDQNVVTIPIDNIFRCLMAGGAMVPVPGAKGNKTFKSQTMSGLRTVSGDWTLLVDGAPVPFAPIKALMEEREFNKHLDAVVGMGFSLFVKRAKVGTSKHIRVRPMFNVGWQARGQIAVVDDQITEEVLKQILEYSGAFKGLGDWRPGGPTPGPYGTFTATVQEVK